MFPKSICMMDVNIDHISFCSTIHKDWIRNHSHRQPVQSDFTGQAHAEAYTKP